LSGGRLRELRQRATVLENDEMDEDNSEDVEEMALYFDTQGRLILQHDGVSYLIGGKDDEGAYDGISNRNDRYTTDDKTNKDSDLYSPMLSRHSLRMTTHFALGVTENMVRIHKGKTP
jgi:hypothetical protein